MFWQENLFLEEPASILPRRDIPRPLVCILVESGVERMLIVNRLSSTLTTCNTLAKESFKL
jgi:hypothetical protein